MGCAKEITYTVDEFGCWVCTSHCVNPGGYPMITRNGKQTHLSRYVYQQTYGLIPMGMVIRHKCDNPKCINPDHLEIGTQKQNVQDQIDRGRFRKQAQGEDHYWAVLKEKDVFDILQRVKDGESQRRIAREYNISESTICDIKHGRSWTHLDTEKIRKKIQETENDKINRIGAYFDKKRKAWFSHIIVNKKQIYLGTFKNQKLAHHAYCEALNKYRKGDE
jgi:hypothetical protein